jgi:hypothetical protein
MVFYSFFALEHGEPRNFEPSETLAKTLVDNI